MGRLFRLARHHARLRQEDVARQAGVSRRALVDIEAGRTDAVRIGELSAAAAVLDLRLIVELRPRRRDLHALTDTGHAALVETVVQHLSAVGWLTRVEAISASGAIDVLAFHPERRMLLVVEVKSRIVDIQRTLREIGYRRAPWRRAADEQGWGARAVSTLLVIRETSAQRRLVAQHRGIFDSAMPLHSAEARAWLVQPTVPAGLLLFMSTVRGQNVIHADSVRVRHRRAEAGRSALDSSVPKRELGPGSDRPAVDSGRRRPIR